MLVGLKTPGWICEAARVGRGSNSACSMLDELLPTALSFFWRTGLWRKSSTAWSRSCRAASCVGAWKGPSFCFFRAVFLPPAGASTNPKVRQACVALRFALCSTGGCSAAAERSGRRTRIVVARSISAAAVLVDPLSLMKNVKERRQTSTTSMLQRSAEANLPSCLALRVASCGLARQCTASCLNGLGSHVITQFVDAQTFVAHANSWDVEPVPTYPAYLGAPPVRWITRDLLVLVCVRLQNPVFWLRA